MVRLLSDKAPERISFPRVRHWWDILLAGMRFETIRIEVLGLIHMTEDNFQAIYVCIINRAEKLSAVGANNHNLSVFQAGVQICC